MCFYSSELTLKQYTERKQRLCVWQYMSRYFFFSSNKLSCLNGQQNNLIQDYFIFPSSFRTVLTSLLLLSLKKKPQKNPNKTNQPKQNSKPKKKKERKEKQAVVTKCQQSIRLTYFAISLPQMKTFSGQSPGNQLSSMENNGSHLCYHILGLVQMKLL